MPCEKLQSNIAHSAQTVNGCFIEFVTKDTCFKDLMDMTA